MCEDSISIIGRPVCRTRRQIPRPPPSPLTRLGSPMVEQHERPRYHHSHDDQRSTKMTTKGLIVSVLQKKTRQRKINHKNVATHRINHNIPKGGRISTSSLEPRSREVCTVSISFWRYPEHHSVFIHPQADSKTCTTHNSPRNKIRLTRRLPLALLKQRLITEKKCTDEQNHTPWLLVGSYRVSDRVEQRRSTHSSTLSRV